MDDVVISPAYGPGGATIATDDIAGVQHQRVKITLGADGVNDGDVHSGNPIPSLAMGENPLTGVPENIWKDAYTGSIVQIDIPHAAIHIGKYFSHSGIVSVPGTGTTTYDHLIVTPSLGGAYVHLRVFVISSSSAPVEHRLYEGTTTSANGTAQIGFNFNRNYPNATLGLYHSPTITGLGTLIHTSNVVGTKQTGGAGETSGTEWVLLQGTKYLSRITNTSGSTASIGYLMEWYEL